MSETKTYLHDIAMQVDKDQIQISVKEEDTNKILNMKMSLFQAQKLFNQLKSILERC